MPVVINNGHECIVAEIVHDADPLPTPLTNEFNPPAHEQIAQMNLTVVSVSSSMLMLPIQVAAPNRKNRKFIITVEIGDNLGKVALRQLGIDNFLPVKSPNVNLSLSKRSNCNNFSGKEEKYHFGISVVRRRR